MKNVLISLQLLVFMLIGIVGMFLFETVLLDMGNDGPINSEIEFATEYAESRDEQMLADRIIALAEDQDIKSVIDLCEKYDLKVAIYYGYKPGYNNLLFSSMNYLQQSAANIYKSDNNHTTLYLKNNNATSTVDSFIVSIAPEWRYLYSHFWVDVCGMIVSAGLFILSILLMHRYVLIVNKVWVYLGIAYFVEVGFVIKLGIEDKIAWMIVLLAEKVFAAIICYFVLNRLNKVYKNVQLITYEGTDVSKVETKPFSLNEFENDMESVSDYVSDAVKEKLKSERLRTELITNVSHDLKTPLTSVINFSDLINKEAEKDTTIAEYSEHLHKQSIKLKELLDALLEASKAASGALEVHTESCNVHTLLEQCVIEYEQRLSDAGIELIEKYPDEDVHIMADVRFLHRIFENILVNMCKYSMPGTRAYIDAVVKNGKVLISFKNISKDPLNISTDELTERFVRGDLSRHTEGNGLGLSVVSSLMELQNAHMELSVNADLFIVELEFSVEQI